MRVTDRFSSVRATKPRREFFFHYPLPVAATKGVVVVVVVVGRLLGQCLGACSSYTTSPSPPPSLASMSTSARRRLLRDFRRYVDDNIVRQS